MTTLERLGALGLIGALSLAGWAQVPALVHHQGRVAVDDVLFDGTGQFRFAFVNADASLTFWRNSPDADANGEPDAAVALPVSRGLYSVLLGDSSLPNMAPIPPAVFDQPAVFLRVWFDDGLKGSERLQPDQRFAAVGYALVAGNVPDGAISAAKLAPSALSGVNAQISSLTAALADLTARHNALAASFTAGLPAGVPVVSADPTDPALTALGMSSFMDVPAPGWVSGATRGEPTGRYGHAAVWTGQSLIVWGGTLGSMLSGAGASYNPTLNQWSDLPSSTLLEGRRGHSAVWTGQAMLIFGGMGATYLNTGAEYSPANLLWSPLPTTGAPDVREGHLALWTGARMLVWGGRNAAGLLASGGLYDPVAKVWSGTPTANAPAGRIGATGVWTGSAFIVWGGVGEAGDLASGAMLPLTGGSTPGAWETLATANAPSARSGHTAVWTGERMLIWGGRAGNTLLNDGAAYNPADNTWAPLPTAGAPLPRSGHVAVWTGGELLIFGGETAGGATATGGAYNPVTGVWRTLSGTGSPLARTEATGNWTGTELLVFGGRAGSSPIAALQRLNPQPAWYFYRKP